MPTTVKVIPVAEAGCFLDNHRGHYIARDVIQLAQSFGFIIGPFEEWALVTYEMHSHDEHFPGETIIELADEAINWLNSGQDVCQTCCRGSHADDWPGPGWDVNTDNVVDGVVVAGERWVMCKACSITGRGPRINGQNFPPRVPDNYFWSYNDGDFGLYIGETEDGSEFDTPGSEN